VSIGNLESKLAEVFTRSASGEVASAYLFGSIAQRREHRESDVDIGVLLSWERLPSRSERFATRLRLVAALAPACRPRDADLVILNDAPPLLGRHVVTTGRRIVCLDEALDRSYFRDVQLRAADLAPWLARMQRLKLVAIARP